MVKTINIENEPLIYFLLDMKVIVYIGETEKEPGKRIYQHTDKKFDDVKCISSKKLSFLKNEYFRKYYELRWINKFKPKRVLDVGCADGLLLSFFYKRDVECYGVDISKKAIMYAPKELRQNLIILDIEKEYLPFKDNTFDVVTNLEVLEHLHNHTLIISEMYRVLKPGGIVLMSSPVDSKIYQAINKIIKLLIKSKTEKSIKDYEVCDFSPHINVHPKKFWIKEFESAGFKLLEDFKKTHKELIIKVIDSHTPKDSIAKFLVKFGKLGRFLRRHLAYHLWSTTLIFKKE